MISLLDIVSDNGQPEAEIGIDDNFRNLLEDMPSSEALKMGLDVGIIGGILIGIFICLVLTILVYFLTKKDAPSADIIEDRESCNTETVVTELSNDTKFIKYIGIFLIFAMVIGTIIGIQNVDSYFKKDYESSSDVNNENKDIPTQKTRNATLDDIYTKITTISDENRTITIQASEKIKSLVIEVRFVDKDGRILKTQEIEVGNISPGNEFTYKLTRDGIQISDLDKINSFKIRVTSGTIEE